MELSKLEGAEETLRGFRQGSLPLTEGFPGSGLTLGDDHTKRDRRRAQWARDVFHSVLAIDLKIRGAATAEQLYHRLSWFMLPFTRLEISQILDSARRGGIIELLPDELDGFGDRASGEWTLTVEGRKVKRARALALPDLGWEALNSSAGFTTAFTSIKGLLLGGASYLTVIFGGMGAGTAEKVALFGASAVVLVTVLWNGVRGDRKLKAAARSWPRMWEKRRARYEYQLSVVRLAFVPAALAGLYVIAVAGVLLDARWWLFPIAALAELVLAGLVYLASGLHKMKQAWDAPHEDLLSWKEVWRLRGQERLAALPPQDGYVPS